MSSFIKDIFRIGISNSFLIIFGLGSSIITARYLGPDKNGIIAALLVYPGLFISIGSLGIRQSTTYFLGKNIYTEEDIKTAITQIWMLTTFISLVISFVLMRSFSNSGDNLLWILLALAPLPFSLFNTYNSGVFLGKNDIKMFNRINWIPSFFSFFGIVFFVIGLELGISGAMIASIVGPLFVTFILLFKNKFIQNFSFNYNWGIIKSMLSLGFIYALALFIINLNYRVDIIIMDKLSTPFELGIYSKGAGVTQYLWQIPAILSTIIFARSSVSNDNYKFSIKVAQLLRLSFLIVGVFSILLIFISPLLIITMYGNEFFNSIKVLQILLPGVLILTIFKVMNTDLAGNGKPWVSMKAMIPALVFNVVFNFILIPKYGANGASISSTISYSLAGVLFLFFYSKETQIPLKTIISYKKSDFDPILQILKKVKKIK